MQRLSYKIEIIRSLFASLNRGLAARLFYCPPVIPTNFATGFAGLIISRVINLVFPITSSLCPLNARLIFHHPSSRQRKLLVASYTSDPALDWYQAKGDSVNTRSRSSSIPRAGIVTLMLVGLKAWCPKPRGICWPWCDLTFHTINWLWRGWVAEPQEAMKPSKQEDTSPCPESKGE